MTGTFYDLPPVPVGLRFDAETSSFPPKMWLEEEEEEELDEIEQLKEQQRELRENLLKKRSPERQPDAGTGTS